MDMNDLTKRSRKLCSLTLIENRVSLPLQNKLEPVLTHGETWWCVTMSSICTSDLHIKHGSVPRAVPGTVGHEMVGGRAGRFGSQTVKPGATV